MVKKNSYFVNGSRLLVQADKPEDKTEAGIILQKPADPVDGLGRGKIVAVGVDCKDNRFKAGKRIVFAMEGIPVKIDGEDYVIIEQEFALLVFE